MATDEQVKEIMMQVIHSVQKNPFNFCGAKIEKDGEDVILHTSFYVSAIEPGAIVGEATHTQRIKPDGTTEVVTKYGK